MTIKCPMIKIDFTVYSILKLCLLHLCCDLLVCVFVIDYENKIKDFKFIDYAFLYY